jgi:tetratricopeptide (TPR) repeat protein
MDAQQQQPAGPQRKISWGRVLITASVFVAMIVIAVLWLIWSPGQWNTILPGLALTVLGIMIALFQWLFPVRPEANERLPQPTSPSIVQADAQRRQPLTGPLSPALLLSQSVYRSLIGVPPPTNVRTIQQRERSVKEIYELLLQPDVTAVALTGIGGVGKSTLAALVYRYAEEQRLAGKGPLQAPAVWLKIDSSAVTMNDLIGTIFEVLDKTLPDLDSLAPHNQAATLINALNSESTPRLIVLDQFENLLDWQTGQALPDHVGVGEWIDAINSQPSASRILLTSRPWPVGTRSYPPTYMQEYSVKGLDLSEGVELLRKLGIQASDEELQQAVQRCAGHAFALTLLGSLLRTRNISLKAFFADTSYSQIWSGNVARNLLNSMYSEQLDAVQRKLLVAFCVYREPVPIEAACAVVDPERTVPMVQWQQALDALLAQHLLQAEGEGLYQLHAIVVGFANDRFDERDIENNARLLRRGYERAANYYRRYAARYGPPPEKRKHIGDVHALVEATWELCQAEQWQTAYELMEQEELYSSLRRWGNTSILLELYQLLLPVQKWQPDGARSAQLYNDLGEIYRIVGQTEQARKYFEQALELSREAREQQEEARALDHIGRVCNEMGESRQALIFYEEALSVYARGGNQNGKSKVLINVGWTYYDLALMEQARAAFEEALQIHQQLGDRLAEGKALNSVGRVHLNLGDLDAALHCHERALHIVKEAADLSAEGWTLNCLGRVYEELAKIADGTEKGREYRLKAKAYLEQSLTARRKAGSRGGEGSTLNNLGVVHFHLKEHKKAQDYLEAALQIRREVGNRSGEAKTLIWLGWLYQDQGQIERTIEYFKQALVIRRMTGQRKHEAKTLSWLGICYIEAGNRDELALACFLLSLDLFEHIFDLDPDAVRRARLTRDSVEALKQRLGEQLFVQLKARVEPRARQIIDEALQSVLSQDERTSAEPSRSAD